MQKQTENLLKNGESAVKKNYYKEIMNYLETKPIGEHDKRIALTHFSICQEYYYFYTMYKKLESSIRVLKYYMADENYIAKRKIKGDKKTEMKIEELLYIEFIFKIHSQNYKKLYSKNKIIEHTDEVVPKILNDYFENEQSDICELCIDSIFKKYQNSYKDASMTKIHDAMSDLEEVLKMPMPTIEESVEQVIIEEQLELMLSYLQAGNIPGFTFTIAPMTRALFDGTYHKFTSRNKCKYFNLQCEYNLMQLKDYIECNKDVEGLRGLYERYKITKESIEKLYK